MPDTCQDGRVKPTVLIIDDDPDIQGLVQATLQEDGVVVTPAYTAAQAEEELGREMFAAIILDLGLPDMPGEELLTKIRKELPDVPVLVLSGQREPTSVVAMSAEPESMRDTPKSPILTVSSAPRKMLCGLMSR